MQASERSPLLADEDRDDDVVVDKKSSRASRFREIAFFIWALVATAGVIIIAVWAQHNEQTSHDGDSKPSPSPPPAKADKRNLVFMVSDGMGPASLSLTRSFRQHVDGLPIDDTLVLDRHFWGTSRTRSSSSLVTDSAAGATAFACARKSYNGAISVTPDYEPCGTVLEAAKRVGYATGLVVTTDITDATPACFASHVLYRAMEDDIALQEVGDGVLGRSVDLMLGGGRCHFLPNSTDGSCREDDVDVTKIAQDKHGWTYTDNRAGFDALEGGEAVDLPFLGLFAPTDIPFELDRRNMADVYPSLSEMATTALRALEKATADADHGFFLMIEGSRIDHAGHINDPAAQVREVLEYDRAFKAVLDFIDRTDTETVLVATSDHETGGLATAIQKPGHLPTYAWYPKALGRANASCELLAHRLHDHLASDAGIASARPHLKAWINDTLIVPGLGVTDVTDDELSALVDYPEVAINTLAAIISFRAHIGWSTHGHTAVDVNIYSSGNIDAVSAIRGNVENTNVGDFLRDYLDVNVDQITKELKDAMTLRPVSAMDLHNGELQGYHFGEAI
jgi:alkaline phosphatase